MSARTSHLALQIAADHPALAGHFPGRPIVPGVVLLDAVLQAVEHVPDGPCWRIELVKFHRVVAPDEPLRLELLSQDGSTRFRLHDARSVVMSGTLLRDDA